MFELHLCENMHASVKITIQVQKLKWTDCLDIS